MSGQKLQGPCPGLLGIALSRLCIRRLGVIRKSMYRVLLRLYDDGR